MTHQWLQRGAFVLSFPWCSPRTWQMIHLLENLSFMNSTTSPFPDSQGPRILWCQPLGVNPPMTAKIHWLRSYVSTSFQVRRKGAIRQFNAETQPNTQSHIGTDRAVPLGRRYRAVKGKSGSHCPCYLDVFGDWFVCLHLQQQPQKVGFDYFENVRKLSRVYVGFFCLFFFSSA